jgi:hypothetical protein
MACFIGPTVYFGTLVGHRGLAIDLAIPEQEPVRRILGHLGLPTEALPLARATDPTDEADDVEPQGQLGLGFA